MIKTVQMIEVDDWDALVVKTYGRPYSFQQQDGCKERGTFNLCVPEEAAEEYDYENDTIPEEVNGDKMGVSFKAWLARDPNQPIEEEGTRWLDLFWTRNFYPAIEMVANDLHSKGLLPAGEYVINIDW